MWRRGDVLQVRQASGQELWMPLVGDETQDGAAEASQRFQKRASLVHLKAIISSVMRDFFVSLVIFQSTCLPILNTFLNKNGEDDDSDDDKQKKKANIAHL